MEIANWIPVLFEIPKSNPSRIKSFHYLHKTGFSSSKRVQITSKTFKWVQTIHRQNGFLPKLHKSQLQTMTSATTQSVVLVMVEKWFVSQRQLHNSKLCSMTRPFTLVSDLKTHQRLLSAPRCRTGCYSLHIFTPPFDVKALTKSLQILGDIVQS